MKNSEIIQNEELVYINTNRSKNPIFDVTFAGVSYPNPNYLKVRELPMNIFVVEYVIMGKGYICSGSDVNEVCRGDMYLIDARRPHRYFADKSEPFEKIWVNVTGKLAESLSDVYLGGSSFRIRHNSDEAYSKLVELHNALRDNLRSGVEVTMRTSLLFHELIMLLASESDPDADNDVRREYAIRECLDRSVCCHITLDELSRRYFISKNHLIRCFKREFGTTPKQYLLLRRIDACEKLLESTSMTIEQIASTLCFASAQHLSAAYKKIRGKSMRRR